MSGKSTVTTYRIFSSHFHESLYSCGNLSLNVPTEMSFRGPYVCNQTHYHATLRVHHVSIQRPVTDLLHLGNKITTRKVNSHALVLLIVSTSGSSLVKCDTEQNKHETLRSTGLCSVSLLSVCDIRKLNETTLSSLLCSWFNLSIEGWTVCSQL